MAAPALPKLKLTKDEVYYQDENENLYHRVSNVIKEFFGGETPPEHMLASMRPENRKRKHGDDTDEEILKKWKSTSKEACRLGSIMHDSIEKFLLTGEKPDPVTLEFQNFMDYFWKPLVEEQGYTFDSAEQKLCYNYQGKMRIAGTFDALFKDPEGRLVLCDWKRSKKVEPDSTYPPLKDHQPSKVFKWHDNSWFHYNLQLNIYRRMYELSHPGKKIHKLLLVCMHENHPDSIRVMDVKLMANFMLDHVFETVYEITENKRNPK